MQDVNKQIFGRVRSYLGGVPAGLRTLVDIVVAKAETAAAMYPNWPLVAIPRALCDAFEVPADRAEAVGAGAVLFYGAADVTDDAQDGDLQPDTWGDPPWLRGVNVGNALAFASLQAFLDAAPPEAVAAMARAYSVAGIQMASGQHLDFELGPDGSAASEDEYLACIEGKSGGSLGLFCQAAGLAAGRPAADIGQLAELGRCVGAAIQIRSDMQEIWSGGPSRDMANGRRTLPVIYALASLDVPGVARLEDLVADPARKPELIALMDALGAGQYCDLRVETYSCRALMALARLDLPGDAHVGLQELVTGLSQPQWRVPI